MDQSPTKPIIAKIRLYRSRAESHRRKAAESEQLAIHNEAIAASWETVLSQIQSLQRQEQPSGAESMPLEELKVEAVIEAANRFDFARQLLIRHRDDGILPVDIRRLANARGFPTPSNFPYKTLRDLLKQGKARRDHQTGRYFPVIKEEPKEK